MVVAKVRAAHVPMKILGLQVQGPHVGENRIHAARDVLRGLCAQIAWSNQRRRAASLQLFLLRFAHCHGSSSDVPDLKCSAGPALSHRLNPRHQLAVCRGRHPATTTPVLYLPTVAGSFISAITLGAFGHPEWGRASELPPPLRPTLGI